MKKIITISIILITCLLSYSFYNHAIELKEKKNYISKNEFVESFSTENREESIYIDVKFKNIVYENNQKLYKYGLSYNGSLKTEYFLKEKLPEDDFQVKGILNVKEFNINELQTKKLDKKHSFLKVYFSVKINNNIIYSKSKEDIKKIEQNDVFDSSYDRYKELKIEENKIKQENMNFLSLFFVPLIGMVITTFYL